MIFTEVHTLSPGVISLSSSSDPLVFPNIFTAVWILIVLKRKIQQNINLVFETNVT